MATRIPSPAGSPTVIRFGLYELDLEARELRKSGIRIKLQDQPFQILAMLLERPGEIVTREELQSRLWAADTFVDFDLSLNSAVKKLRQALNDDSDNPRFIETLYRRGYRFIGPIHLPAWREAEELPAGPVLVDDLVNPPIAPEENTRGFVRGTRAKTGVMLAALFVLVAGGAYLWWSPGRSVHVLGYRQITRDGQWKGPIVTDGDRVYVQEIQDARFVIAQVSANGGDAAILPTPFSNAGLEDVAPDGSALLVSDFKGSDSSAALWLVPLPAGAPRRITDLKPSTATWSPSGTEIALSTGSDIFLVNSDGTALKNIAKVNGAVSWLRFSPDGRTLRFSLGDPHSAASEIWEVNRDGGNLHSLIGRPAFPFACCGNWSPDGKQYVFQTLVHGIADVWTLPEKAHWFSHRPEPIQLTNGPLQFDFPVPSHDGKKVFVLGSHPRSELLRVDSKLGFVPYFGSTSASDLSFSPDGQWVAYVSIPDLTLWRSRIDGTSPLQLTPSSINAALPRWSPDGKQIIFMGRTESTNYRAYTVSMDSSDLRDLMPGVDIAFDPNWSADGKSVIFSSSDMVAPGAGISFYEIASGQITELPDSRELFSPRPSPDGKYIAAITKDYHKLMLFDLQSRKWLELTQPPLDPISYPNWSRDSQYLYFDTTFSKDPGIYRIRMADRNIERVSTLKGVRRFQTNLGLWTGLAPDGSPLLSRDISSQEIYALDWKTK